MAEEEEVWVVCGTSLPVRGKLQGSAVAAEEAIAFSAMHAWGQQGKSSESV